MKKNKYLLLVSSLGSLLLLLAAAAQENFLKEWRRIQAAGAGDGGPIAVQLRQVVNPQLGVADRCVSCHVAMGPGEQNVRGGKTLTPHPPVVHDPAEFGCTVCHGGQGQANGDVHFWPEPMLDKPVSYAGCGRCHAALGVPEREQYREAALAFERLDCYACHRSGGKGGVLRPDGGGMEGPGPEVFNLVADPTLFRVHKVRERHRSFFDADQIHRLGFDILQPLPKIFWIRHRCGKQQNLAVLRGENDRFFPGAAAALILDIVIFIKNDKVSA